ncbi:hypothetical protein GCM10028807_12010 [Spirosoma daeguense]
MATENFSCFKIIKSNPAFEPEVAGEIGRRKESSGSEAFRAGLLCFYAADIPRDIYLKDAPHSQLARAGTLTHK